MRLLLAARGSIIVPKLTKVRPANAILAGKTKRVKVPVPPGPKGQNPHHLRRGPQRAFAPSLPYLLVRADARRVLDSPPLVLGGWLSLSCQLPDGVWGSLGPDWA